MPQRVLIDACVLFPPLVRTILIEVAARGVFVPLWSPRILNEWWFAIARKHGLDAEKKVLTAQKALAKRFPDASVAAPSDLEATLKLPDAADAHVLAAAIEGKAEILLTFNLRDFPPKLARRHGVEIAHPDGFLWQLLGDAAEPVSDAVSASLQEAGISAERRRAALKRAKLPRFAKALAATEDG